MNLEISYQGERIIIPDTMLGGYEGCVVIAEHEELPEDDIYLQVSPEHLSSVHLQKALEAVMILSGYNLWAGLLADEAEATGTDLKKLAKQVQEKRRAERDFECERRSRKMKKAPE